jgi:hypothetical protein
MKGNALHAMRPALSAEELLAGADLAGRARVISIKPRSDGQGRVAVLRFESFLKRHRSNRRGLLGWLQRTVRVNLRAGAGRREEHGPGGWPDGYRPGDTVMTHLRWDDDAKAYVTLSWNAVWLTPPAR